MRIIIFLLVLVFVAPAYAQTLTGDMDAAPAAVKETPAAKPAAKSTAASPSSSLPLEITADTTLEWQRNGKTFIARGNALAKQGDTSVAAATLTAHYTDKDGGGMKISQVHADDNVIIRSKDSEAYGTKADYDLDKGYAVMTGDNLRMTSPDQTVTAHDKFEYWTTDGRFVAAGQAKVVRGTNTLQADKISAVMKNNAKGQRALETLEAEGNVVIVTPTETVTGAYGIYKAATNMANMTGGVKIQRGPNVLEGDRAEVDMTTNTSRIFGGSGENGRVKGVFYPDSQKKP